MSENGKERRGIDQALTQHPTPPTHALQESSHRSRQSKPRHAVKPARSRGNSGTKAILGVVATVLIALVAVSLTHSPILKPHDPNVTRLGASITVDTPYGTVAFTVIDRATIKNSLDAAEAKPGMVFVLVPVKIEYLGTDYYLHTGNHSLLVGGNGIQYEPDIAAMVHNDSSGPQTNPFFLLTLEAGQSAKGVFVYEVPEGTTEGAKFCVMLDEESFTMDTGL